MNELPDTQTLLEMLVLAKEAEQKMREVNEKAEQFAQKWESRMRERQIEIKLTESP